MKRITLIALFATSSVFAQNYSCSNDGQGNSIGFKIENKSVKGSLMTGTGTRMANSISFAGTQAANLFSVYDVLDEKGSVGKLTISTQPTYHRSGLMASTSNVSLEYLGETLKFYYCSVTGNVVTPAPQPLPHLPEFPCHTRACAF